ncbi:hypothetical protein [Paraburkholderia sp.]|uniref:hypothetical protein n=1 Tax=Paraburkholderia sp. TaxID=1926495 RepID=UPI0039E5E074
MIKLEISITGAGTEELRQLEALMQKILASMKPQLTRVEAKVALTPAVDRYESTKKKILSHIQWQRTETTDCMKRDFWELDIQDWLNPKDKRDLGAALDSLCEDGMLECTGLWEYYLTSKGYNAIY